MKSKSLSRRELDIVERILDKDALLVTALTEITDEMMRRGWALVLENSEEGTYKATFVKSDKLGVGSGVFLAEAICRAALAALEEGEK